MSWPTSASAALAKLSGITVRRAYELTDDGDERVSNGFLFDVLGFDEKERSPMHGSRIARVMKKQGWEYHNSIRIGGKTTRGYQRAFWSDLM